MSLKDYRNELKNALLDLAWSQWTALGVAGHTKEYSAQVIDLESLILFTLFIGQYDQRLFDSMLDWLQNNGRFVNTQRLISLHKKNEQKNANILSYVAANLTAFESRLKWHKLAKRPSSTAETKPLFKDIPSISKQARDEIALQYGLERNPYKFLGKQTAFNKSNIATLQLKLRGFFGVNSRAEVILILLSKDYCKNQDIANSTGFSWKSIQDILFEMTYSGIVSATQSKKSRLYHLSNIEKWNSIFGISEINHLKFPTWSDIFFSLEQLYETLENPKLDKVSALSVMGVVEKVFQQIGSVFLQCGIGSLREANTTNYLNIPSMINTMIIE